jgi:hypothetical protein
MSAANPYPMENSMVPVLVVANAGGGSLLLCGVYFCYRSKYARIGVVVKQCFSFSNNFVMSSVHFQSFGDPLVELLRGLPIFENPSTQNPRT